MRHAPGRFRRRSIRGVFVAISLLAAVRAGSAAAQVWTYETPGGTAAWSETAAWRDATVPTSGTATAIEFFSGTTTPLPAGLITSTNDLGGFTLGRLSLNGLGPETTGTTTVLLGGDPLSFGGAGPAIVVNGRSPTTTRVLAYQINNDIAFDAATSLAAIGNATLDLTGGISGTSTLTKTGTGTIQFSGDSSSSFSGGLVIAAGGITVNGGLGGRLPASQAIVFTGPGQFTFAANSQSLTGTAGAIEFQRGSGLLTQNRGSAGTGFLTVASVTLAEGATGRFSIGGGSNGSNTGIRIADRAAGFMGANLVYGGFAYYVGTGTTGYVNTISYGTTPDSVALSGSQATLGANPDAHVRYTASSGTAQASTGSAGNAEVTVATPGNFALGSIVTGGVPAFTYVTAISGSTLTLSKALTSNNPSLTPYTAVTAQPTGTIASLRMDGNGGTIRLDDGATLTISSGGLYRAGNNSSSGGVIAGGSGITTGGTSPFFYWADGVNGGLSIQTPMLATTTGGLVVSGPAIAPLQLAAASTFTGGVWLNGGILEVAATETAGTSGPLGAAGPIRFYGGTLRYSSANAYDYSPRFSSDPGQTFTVNTNSQSVAWATSITAADSVLDKQGPGALTLSASNAFVAAAVSGGLVRVGDAAALGSGTVTISVAGLAAADSTPQTISNPVRIAASPTFGASGAGQLTLSGPVELVPAFVTFSNAGSVLEISGPITGSGTVSLGNGTSLTLSGNNSGWTPAALGFNNGGITVGHPNALGVGDALITATNSSTLVVNADLTGANARANSLLIGGGLTVSGSEGLTLNGVVTQSGGNRTLTNNLPAGKPITLAGGVLLRTAADSAHRTLSIGGSGDTTISGTVANGGTSGSGSILKSGTGILRLTAANTYTGTTGISQGVLSIAGTASLPGWSTAGRYTVANGAALAAGTAVTDADLATMLATGNFAAGASVGFDTTDGDRVYADPLANTAAGTLGLVKLGSGTLALTAANTYTGPTAVRDGTLRLGVAGALPGTTSVTMANSGSLDLGVDATITGAVAASGPASAIFGSGTLTAASFTFSNPSGTATASAVLAGAGATLTKSNNGTLEVSAASTFGGKTTVSGGTLEFSSIAAVGGGPSSLGAPASAANGTIALGSGGTAATLRYVGSGHTSDRVLNLAGTTGGATLEAAGSGPLVLTAANTATGGGTKTFTLTGTSAATNSIGSIAGSGVSVTKTGPGLWRLADVSSFDGRFTVEDGTILAGAGAGTSGSGVFGQATGDADLPLVGDSADGATGQAAVLLESGVTVSRGLVIAALGGGATQEAILGMAGGSGTATFGTFGGTGVTIRLGRDLTLQAADGGTVEFFNAWKDAGGGDTPQVAFRVGSAGNAGTVVLGSPVPDSITATTVRRGILRLDAGDETLGFGTPVTLGETGAGGTLDINGTMQPLASLAFAGVNSSVSDVAGGGRLALYNSGSAAAVSVAGTGHTISAAMQLDDAATFTVASGGRLGISSVIADGTSGARGLTKTGLGILELAGANTFTGNTTVSAGTLVVNGSLAGGALEVAAGATLMGSGTIGGAATILGIHSPGNSPGVETFAANLTYSGSTSEVIWELWGNTASASDRGSVFDGINVTGDLAFAAPTSLELDFGGSGVGTVDWDDPFWNSDQTWTLFDVAGTTTGFSPNFSLTSNPASWLDSSGQAFSASVRSGGSFSLAQQGSDVLVQYTAVPEPAAAVLALAGLGLAAAWMIRRPSAA